MRASMDRDSDAPQGPPRKAPEATDATPWPASSRFGDQLSAFSDSNAEHTDTDWRKSTAAKVAADSASLRTDPPKHRATSRSQGSAQGATTRSHGAPPAPSGGAPTTPPP